MTKRPMKPAASETRASTQGASQASASEKVHHEGPRSRPGAKPRAKPTAAHVGKGWRRPIAALGFVALTLASSVALLGYRAVGQRPGAVTVQLRGDASDVETMQHAGIVDAAWFSAWARLTGFRARAGSHLLPGNLTAWQLTAAVRGDGPLVRVTFPEGFHRFDMGRRLEGLGIVTKASYLAASSDPLLLAELGISGDSAEGYLFPATYEFPMDADPRAVVRRQKQEFDKRFAGLVERHNTGRADLEASLRWGPHQIVTLASMVEKEAAVEEDRPLIASVFLNRLREPTFTPRLLQCDPTAGYGCVRAQEGGGPAPSGCAHFRGKITREVNVDPSNAYSTYSHEGLPPGPIANPGASSLRAVLDPKVTRFLYFYARPGSPKHTFSETYEAHQQAIRGQAQP
jgi:UPF0755 protein